MSDNPSRAGSRASRAGDARPRDSTGRYTGIGKAGKEQASTPAGDQRQLQIAHGETEQASGGEVALAEPGGSMVNPAPLARLGRRARPRYVNPISI